MEGYHSDTYGERFADVYDDWYADITDSDATVASVARLAGDRPVLELGVGTGRLALPLAATGADVVGLDASPAMLGRLRAKPGADDIRLVRADMAAPPLRGPFGVVFVAFNSFFNLGSELAQRACLARVADLLGPDGRLVLEAFIPSNEPDGSARGVEVKRITADRALLSLSMEDPHEQTAWGQHIEITESGIRMRPWHIRYLRPDQLDRLAHDAGLILIERWADWTGAPFDPDAPAHISLYGRAG